MVEYQNAILRSLPHVEADAIQLSLHRTTLVQGQVLYENDSIITDAFFIEKGVVSLAADTADNAHVEVGLTGHEGLVGVWAILSPHPWSMHRAFIQVPGFAYRIDVGALRVVSLQATMLMQRCLQFVDFSLAQTAQLAACNARHTVQQRLARWLLMIHDRLAEPNDTLPMTQEFLSIMLGVRRSGVSVASAGLQSLGLIQVTRGHVRITDHQGLSRAACECYRIIKRRGQRIL